MQYQKLLSKVKEFRDERDWKQYHSARNLALSIVLESSELLEIFQWKTDRESDALVEDPETRIKLADELSDILLYTMLMSDSIGINLLKAAAEKIKKNAKKYPIEKSKGNSLKYTEL